MTNPLITKLESFAELSSDDRAAIARLGRETRAFDAKQDIIGEGDRPEHVHLVLDGWAARYKVMASGARQIVAFLIPGDFCDIHVNILARMDHGIMAITPCTVAYLPTDAFDALLAERSLLSRTLWWAALVDEAVLRQWVLNVGRRDAYEAVAHLLCEMHFRMKLVGLVTDDRFSLPLTQEELSDATAMTPVHINRVLQRLRREGLIELAHRQLHVLDLEGLRRAGGFETEYFHIAPRNPSGRRDRSAA